MLKNRNSLFIIVALIIVITGIIMFCIKGFNYAENTMELKDLMNPYIMPMLISLLIITIYYVIKYKKIGILQVLTYIIIGTLGVQLIYLSIYSITRVQINILTMPISMLIYALTFFILNEIFNKKLKNISNK